MFSFFLIRKLKRFVNLEIETQKFLGKIDAGKDFRYVFQNSKTRQLLG